MKISHTAQLGSKMHTALVVPLLALLVTGFTEAHSPKVICYWDGSSYNKEGLAKVTVEEIKPALAFCTHVIYGFAKIDDDDSEIEPIDKKLDLDKGVGQYRLVTNLKKTYPHLKVMLSVGGNRDEENADKYLEMLESPKKRTKFVTSASNILREYGFDGLDLAWQFPPKNEKNKPYTLTSIWHKVKKTVGIGVDSKAAEHRAQFVSLVRELKGVLQSEKRQLSLAVLPHINVSVYYDVKELSPHVDFVNLITVDLRTPERSPELADFAAPVHFAYGGGRLEHQNVDFLMKQWIHHGLQPSRVNVAIPTYGRSWKLTKDSPVNGVPPLLADGPGKKGTSTKVKGLLAYYEICNKLVSPTNAKAPSDMLRRISDPTTQQGTYAYRLPSQSDDDGLWVSYEEPETAKYKAAFSRQKGLGGIVIWTLALDDYKGVCDGNKFPITKAAKNSFHSAV